MLTLSNSKMGKVKDYHLQLHLAATNGNVGLVKFALDHGAPMDSVVNGFLPLQLACISDNNLAVVQYLIDRGAQVNAQRWSKKHIADKSQAVAGAIGSTALHVACANGCTKVVELLLRNDAQIDLKDKYGSRPRDIAIAKHHMEIVMLLDISGTKRGSRHQERRSMDHIQYLKYQQQQQQQQYISDNNSGISNDNNERTRRQSLPAVLEDQSQFRKRESHQWNTNSPQAHFGKMDAATRPIDIIPDILLPELSSSLSNTTDTFTPLPSPTSIPYSKKPDRYSYGVLNHDGNESYLTSLERRAYKKKNSPARHSYDQSYLLKAIEYSSSAAISPESSFSSLSMDTNYESSTSLVPQKSLSTTAINTAQISNDCNLTVNSSSSATMTTKAMEDLGTKKSYWRAFERRQSTDTTTTVSNRYLGKLGASKELDKELVEHDINTVQPTSQQYKSGFLARWTASRSKK